MKRIIALATVLVLLISVGEKVNATEYQLIESSTKMLDNGFVIIDELYKSCSFRSTEKEYTRQRKIVLDGDTIAVIAITAKFRYDGNTVSVISKSVSQCDTYGGWSYKQTSFTASGGTVTLKAKLTKLLIFNETFQMTLSCDKNGNVSYT